MKIYTFNMSQASLICKGSLHFGSNIFEIICALTTFSVWNHSVLSSLKGKREKRVLQ
jgi:hypothetical protein